MKSKAKVEWRDMPELFITLEHEGMHVTVHADGIWPVLAPFQIKDVDSIFVYHLKDGSMVNLSHTDQAQHDASLAKLVNEYLPELWEVFGHFAQPFTQDEPWLPSIFEQL